MLKLIDLYDKQIITESTCFAQLIDQANLEELPKLPEKWLKILKEEYVDTSPAMREGLNEYIRIGSCCGNEEAEMDSDTVGSPNDWRNDAWERLLMMREFFDGNKS